MQFPVSHLSGRLGSEILTLGNLTQNLESPGLSGRVDSPGIINMTHKNIDLPKGLARVRQEHQY